MQQKQPISVAGNIRNESFKAKRKGEEIWGVSLWAGHVGDEESESEARETLAASRVASLDG